MTVCCLFISKHKDMYNGSTIQFIPVFYELLCNFMKDLHFSVPAPKTLWEQGIWSHTSQRELRG